MSTSSSVAYIPVLHRGYVRFVRAAVARGPLYLLNQDLLARFDHLRKDVRALTPQEVLQALQALLPAAKISLADEDTLAALQADQNQTLYLPDEVIMHELAHDFFLGHSVVFESVFLRWDKKHTLAEQTIEAIEEQSTSEFDNTMLNQALRLSEKSADWWRQVGGVVVKDGTVILEAVNRHVPHEQQPYFDGDPRGNFHKGEHIELSTAFHAEASLIAQAAAQGISLTGASMYVTTFPCPACAKLVAYSGVDTLYFQDGYAMLDGQSILRSQGVKLIRVLPSSQNKA